jgi:hypothetical protein
MPFRDRFLTLVAQVAELSADVREVSTDVLADPSGVRTDELAEISPVAEAAPLPGRSRGRRVTGLAFAAAGLSFAGLQWLVIAAYDRHLHQLALSHGIGYLPVQAVWPDVAYVLGRWVALAAATLVLVRRSPRWAPVPASCFTLLPWLVPAPGGGRLPGALGVWNYATANPSRIWLGAVIDTCLVLIPAAASYLSCRPPRRTPRRADPVNLAALASSIGLVWLVLYNRDLIVGLGTTAADLHIVAALFVIAAAARLRHRTDLLAYAALVLLLATMIPMTVLQRQLPNWTNDVVANWPYVIPVAAGLSWAPLARLLGHLQRSPGSVLLVAVNLLNVADAVLTVHAVRHVGAVEANGIVKIIGLPAKIVIVGIATIILARTRKRALIWPILGLAAVVSWHVGGLLVGP